MNFTYSAWYVAPLAILFAKVCLGTSLEPDVFEPDNLPTQAHLVSNASSFEGSLHVAGDVDWAAFNAIGGRYYLVELNPIGSLSGLDDGALEVFDTDGEFLTLDDDRGEGLGAAIKFRAEYSGRYYLKVRAGTGTPARFSSAGGGPEILKYKLVIMELINGAPVLDGFHLMQDSVPPEIMLSMTVAAHDPDNDDLRFDFDWGDGSRTFGASAIRSHAWTSEGAYCVRVRVRDILGANSPWSACSLLTVSASAVNAPPVLLVYCDTDYSGLHLFELDENGSIGPVGTILIPFGNGEKPFVFRLNSGEPAVVMNAFKDADLRKSTVFLNAGNAAVSTVRPPSRAVAGRFENPIYARAVHLRDGRLLAVMAVADPISNQIKSIPSSTYLETFESVDQGASWRHVSSLHSDPEDPNWSGIWQPSLLELSNGNVMMAAVEQRFHSDPTCPNTATLTYRDDTIIIMRSSDGGRSWAKKVHVPLGGCGTDYNEPALAQLTDGRFALVAHEAKTGSLVISYGSADAKLWSAPLTLAPGSSEIEHRYPIFTASAASARLVFRTGARGQPWWESAHYSTALYAGQWGAIQSIATPQGLSLCKLS